MNNDDLQLRETIDTIIKLMEKNHREKAFRKAAEESAEELRVYYEALKKQGFTSDQAYGLLIETIRINNGTKR